VLAHERRLGFRGIVADGILPPGLPGYDSALAGYPYDPAQARRLLAAAGLSGGMSATLWMPADQTMMILGQSIQQDLELVGVHLLLKPVAFAPLLEAMASKVTSMSVPLQLACTITAREMPSRACSLCTVIVIGTSSAIVAGVSGSVGVVEEPRMCGWFRISRTSGWPPPPSTW